MRSGEPTWMLGGTWIRLATRKPCCAATGSRCGPGGQQGGEGVGLHEAALAPVHVEAGFALAAAYAHAACCSQPVRIDIEA